MADMPPPAHVTAGGSPRAPPTVEKFAVFTCYEGRWEAWLTDAPPAETSEKVFRVLIPVPPEIVPPAITAQTEPVPVKQPTRPRRRMGPP